MENQKAKRLYSLDALRGFDMFWITGGSSLFAVSANLSRWSWIHTISGQMQHVPWIGFRFYDLIFPLFMFVAGIAIPFSIRSKLNVNATKKNLILKVFKRMVMLVLLGLLYNGVFQNGFDNARYASILGQIGIAYFFAYLIIIFPKSHKTKVFWLMGILIGVAVIQLFIPVPGIGAGVFTPEGCINGFIDRHLLPGRLSYNSEGIMIPGNGVFDALGLLSIVSATGITLMGAFAGYILQMERFSQYRRTAILAAIGIVLIIIALLLSPYYPIIKNCWTTTFNLLTGGISFMLIALFYLVIDVWHYSRWSFYFRIIGMNSIFVYLFVRIVPVKNIVRFFIGWIAEPMGESTSLVIAIGYLAAIWLLLYFMYKRNIFLKV